MAETSKIQWTDSTFNPWRGCTKVSPGCTHCYAETLSGRNHGVLGVWGPRGTRPVAAESYWRGPVNWNRAAKRKRRGGPFAKPLPRRRRPAPSNPSREPAGRR